MTPEFFLLLLFLLLVAGVWSLLRLYKSVVYRKLYRALATLTAVIAIPVSFYFTHYYMYFPNPNTQVFGWPIPKVVFQRDSPTGPWLDYVGPTVFLAFPINFVIFACVPLVLLSVFSLLHNRRRAGSA